MLLPLDKSCQLMGDVFPPSAPGRNPASVPSLSSPGTKHGLLSHAQQVLRPPSFPSDLWSTLGYPNMCQVKSPSCMNQHCLSSLRILCCDWDGPTAQRPQEQDLDLSNTFLNRKLQKIYKLERKMNRTLCFQCQEVSRPSEGRLSICVPAA